MQLVDIVRDREKIDENLIIFQKTKSDFTSDVILLPGEEGDSEIKTLNGTKYYYLIEIFLAKEFIDDWVRSLDYLPDEREIAERLFEYAINDA